MTPRWLVPSCAGTAVFGICGLLTSATTGVVLGLVVACAAVVLIGRYPALGQNTVKTQLEAASVLATIGFISVLMYEPRGPDWERAGVVAAAVFFVLLIAAGVQRFRREPPL